MIAKRFDNFVLNFLDVYSSRYVSNFCVSASTFEMTRETIDSVLRELETEPRAYFLEFWPHSVPALLFGGLARPSPSFWNAPRHCRR